MTNLADSAIPAFARGMKFRFDGVRDIWVVLGPERMFQPDEHAVEVLRLIDGRRDFGAMLDDLCERFVAPREVMAADISELLRDLAVKGVLTL